MKKLVLLFCALCFSGLAAAATVEEDVNDYLRMFADGQSFNGPAVESLAWKGISDTRVFDLIERRVNERAEAGHTDRHIKNEVALYIRALGFSGQAKYRPTIRQYQTDRDYARVAENALEDLPKYQQWNPLISDRASFDPQYSDDVNRIRNMLRANDFDLKKIGAKRVYFKNKEEVLLATLAEQIRGSYMSNNERNGDSIAWMVKALGSAREPKYRPLIEEVAANAPDNVIVRHARKALER